MPSDDFADGWHNPLLSINRTLPTSIDGIGAGKERVRSSLEFLWWQETGRASVIFAQTCVAPDLSMTQF